MSVFSSDHLYTVSIDEVYGCHKGRIGKFCVIVGPLAYRGSQLNATTAK